MINVFALSSLVGIILMTSGCAGVGLMAGGSDEKIKSITAIELDMDEKNIAISDKKVIDEFTYYTVTTKKGAQYRCRTEGGGIVYAGSMTPPQCAKKGEKLPEAYNPETLSKRMK